MANKDQLMLLKTKDVDADKTAFEKFEQEVKSIIFGIMFLMLKTEQESLLKLLIILIVQAIQLFSLVFNPYINFPWRGYIVTDYFQGFLQVFQIAYWCTFLNWVSYLIIYYTGVGIVALIVLDIIYAAYTVSNKKITVMWPIRILRNLFGLLTSVLYMPLIGIPVDIFS